MADFGQIIAVCALPFKLGHLAIMVYKIDGDGPVSHDEMAQFLKVESGLEITRETVIPMGGLFEDVYGYTALKIYCTDPHPFPDRIDLTSTIYARKLYTQGMFWVCLTNENGELFSFQSNNARDAMIRWIIQSQPIWRDKYHAHTDPAESQISVISGESLDGLIGRIKNAP